MTFDPDRESRRLEEVCSYSIDKAMALGADGVFVSAHHGLGTKAAYEKKDYNLVSCHEGGGVSLSIHKDERCGGVWVNSFDKNVIEDAIRRGLDLALPTIPDPYIALAPKADYHDLSLPFDPAIVELDPDFLIKTLKVLVEESTKDRRVKLDSAGVDQSVGLKCLANSKGMMATEQHARLSWFAMGMAIEGDEVTSMDYRGNWVNGLGEEEQRVRASGCELSQRLLASLGGRKIRSYKGKVLLPPSLVEELLLDPLVFHLQGSQIMDGKSRFGDALGKKIANESFSFGDDPFDITLRGAAAFSGEGVPTQPMVIVENGILLSHFDSLYSSRRRGTKPTGNGGGPHCPYVVEGAFSQKELLGDEETLLRPSRFSGNLDPLSGDFSGLAKGASVFSRGEDQGAAKEVMISGNVFSLLKGELLVGADRWTDGGYYRLPHVLVDGVSVVSD